MEKLIKYLEWEITYNPKPIGRRDHDYDAVHKEYSGDGDDRYITAGSIEQIKKDIDGFNE